MRQGYSIVEILIVIAILGILAGGILSAYKFIAKENVERHYVAKQESEAEVLINQLIKDIEAAGFGIDVNALTLTSITADTVSGYTLMFPSLAGREEKLAGCWAVLNNGSITSYSKNFMGQDCQFLSAWYVVLEPNSKKNLCPSDLDYLCNDLTGMSGLAFYATTNNNYKYPQSFIVTYSLNQQNLPKECAIGTFNLVKTLGTSGFGGYQANQPVISCIFPGGFRIRAGVDSGGSISYQDSVSSSDIQNKKHKLFRLCLIVQIGGRQDTSSQQPQFSGNCGGPIDYDNTNLQDWWNNTGRWYRWKVVEQDILLRNYQ